MKKYDLNTMWNATKKLYAHADNIDKDHPAYESLVRFYRGAAEDSYRDYKACGGKREIKR